LLLHRKSVFNSFAFLLALGLVGILSFFVHELGHGLTTVALGGKFHALYVWPGIEIWPDPGQRLTARRMSNIGLVHLDYPAEWGEGSFQDGLVGLMGSGSNLLAAALALATLLAFHPRGGLFYLLVAESLMFLDILLYTFLPLVGLRHFFIVGGASPEPLSSAQMLGIPAWAFMLAVLLISALLAAGFVKTIQGAKHG
jgi:hypothetical protein